MNVRAISWYIRLDDALRIVKQFKHRKHRDKGYFFNLTEMSFNFRHLYNQKLLESCYRDYTPNTPMALLEVMREVDGPDFSPNEIAALKKLIAKQKLVD